MCKETRWDKIVGILIRCCFYIALAYIFWKADCFRIEEIKICPHCEKAVNYEYKEEIKNDNSR